jgi:hypothetical protein
VDVEVKYCLTGGLPDVDADVVPVRPVTLGHNVACYGEGAHEGGLLLSSGVEPGRDVPPRDEQRVAGGDGETVPESPCEFVLVEDSFRRSRVAERAGLVTHVRRPLAVGDGVGDISSVRAGASLGARASFVYSPGS